MTNTLKRFLGLAVLQHAAELAAGQGRRSYPAPHCGAPGEVGGSRPREKCGMKEGKDVEESEAARMTKGKYPKGEDTTTKRIDEWLIADVFPDDDARQRRIAEEGWEKAYTIGRNVQGQVATEMYERAAANEEDTVRVLDMWLQTSADEDLRSLHLQRLAAEEFGVEVRPSILERIASIEERRKGTVLLNDPQRSFAEHGIDEETQRALLRGMYDYTQESLAEADFRAEDTIRLRRGVLVPREIEAKWKHGQEVELTGNPLSSWSVGAHKADEFAFRYAHANKIGVLFEMDVPREAVISTARTGLGELTEGEFVVLLDKLGHRAKVEHIHWGIEARADTTNKDDAIPPVDIDWCEENEDWLRRKGNEKSATEEAERSGEAQDVLKTAQAFGVMERLGFPPKVQQRDYPSPHCGRPGEVGGSAPREECAAGAEVTLRKQLQGLKPRLAAAAQEIYDHWEPDESWDPYGGGGICDAVTVAMGDVVSEELEVEIRDGGQPGDDHAWLIIFDEETGQVWGIDIPSSVYETGGGYSWQKLPDVVIKSGDVEIFDVGWSIEELEHFLVPGEGWVEEW